LHSSEKKSYKPLATSIKAQVTRIKRKNREIRNRGIRNKEVGEKSGLRKEERSI